MSDHEPARSRDQKHPPSFMDRVRILRSEHALCVVKRDGQTIAALHHTTTGDDRVVLCCGRCRASWTLTITPDDARELEEYVRQRRERRDAGQGDGE
jgi:hypothetical protein